MNTFCVYKHTSPNGKAYIGQTKNYNNRSIKHKNPNSGCRAFASAIKKYGWDNFLHEILEDNLTLEEANVYENLYIVDHGTLAPNGYNLTTGGDNKKFCEESINKAKKTRASKEPYRHTLEAKLKIGEASKRQICSEETRDKIRIAMTGRIVPIETIEKIKQTLKENPYKHTEEQLKKMSDAAKKRIHTRESIEKGAGKNRGLKRSMEARLKMSLSAKNKPPISEETRLKISIGNSKPRPDRIGIKQSKETCEKRRISMTGLKRSPETKIKQSLATTMHYAIKQGRPFSYVSFYK